MHYTGIGSRETPYDVGQYMKTLALDLSDLGYVLRSGAANGADSYFESGALSKEIYLPWRGFNNHPSRLHRICDAALEIASMHHPAWERLPDAVRKLMARNAYQVSGLGLDDFSEFVICWTPDGCEHFSTRSYMTGGTGLAISLASSLGIPVYNLRNPSSQIKVRQRIDAMICQRFP